MHIVSIVGARPQFVKIAPVCRAIERHNAKSGSRIDDCILHTGQHYDASMSDVFFEELGIPRADVHLGVGSGSHGQQTGRMLERIETVLVDRRPDAVVVYGDTNSTLAGALAATKLHIRVVHVEAGLRSHNRRMPEEINRVATDHISDLLLAPTPAAARNLVAEQLGERTVFTGDVMFDSVLDARARAEHTRPNEGLRDLAGRDYAVVTLHRAENTTPAELRLLLALLNEVAETRIPLVFPLHPRSARMLETDFADWRPSRRLRLVSPLGYVDMIRLVDGARLVLTDSGGLQKEAFFIGCPCVTLREETEWTETVDAGANIVAGSSRASVLNAVDRWLGGPARPIFAVVAGAEPFGNGEAAVAIVAAIARLAG